MIQNIDISVKGLELSEELSKYIHKKIGRLDRMSSKHAKKSIHAEVKIKAEEGKKNDKYTVEAILHVPHGTLTAKDSTLNVFAAIDIVEAKLGNQLRKYKDKATDHKSDRKGILKKMRKRVDREIRGRQN